MPIHTMASRRPRPGRPVTREEVTDAILAGQWVIDLRQRGHSRPTAPYAGWLVPCEEDFVLLYDSPADVAAALPDLAAIGIDGPGVHDLAHSPTAPGTFRRTDWTGFREHTGPLVVVDVRERDEYDAGHLPGAVHLPVHE